jgi:hypothetical protein
VYFQHAASGTDLVFDDPNLISASGLQPMMRLDDPVRAGPPGPRARWPWRRIAAMSQCSYSVASVRSRRYDHFPVRPVNGEEPFTLFPADTYAG